MKRIYLVLYILALVLPALAQENPVRTLTLDSVTVEGLRNRTDLLHLAPVQNTYLFSGKKNEVIELTRKDVALTEKYGRQIFAKVPGVFVYDMDGTGNQVNIATRGLDPHRGWEFNIRKDGVLTNSDMYGYPASHYNIPMEAVERIELVRGTGSLQYGAQFGGMLSYVSKQPDPDRPLAFESVNTVGSYGLVSTYNSLSGTVRKFRYSVWANKKKLDGYRQNSRSNYDAENVSLFYDVSKDLHLKLEWTHSNYLIQLAGPLTDAMFRQDPQAATRSRNYYNPDIHVPSFTLDWNLGDHTQLKLTTSAVLGSRGSVLFDKPATVADTINPSTLQYSNRQVDLDQYHSYTTELRLQHSYPLFHRRSTLVGGVQYMNNDLHRRQMGRGTTGTDYDLTLVSPGWGRDLHFKTRNLALFAENRWALFKGFSLNTGLRVETGQSDMRGTITYYPANELPTTIRHRFPLLGVNAEYNLNKALNLYGGWSQAYRPVIFKDIVPGSVYEATDKNLKDAYGYNLEAGVRGKWQNLSWDVTAFRLVYNNRLGTLASTDAAGNLTVLRTNTGDSHTHGLEMLVQGDFRLGAKSTLNVFTATSFMDARYRNARVKSGQDNVRVDGNKVESVPNCISRNGATFQFSFFSLTALYSYTADSFADALNAVEPSPSGATGLVSAYHLFDLNISLNLSKRLRLQLNGNNLFDAHYFTKRPQFYPGPGIWPSDGRTLSATVAVKL
ncbi:TonB-dependent receptor family protein [Salmonirosea aquatica]|uniref:TonB-dependent receptor n=1 Tax=Salmonirosea aquatica TaxID=2654236 RepID=A0A7C9BES4_9BACT|nr:TonB-dependent receptor [Cytophagaceae bacterium SJW1-29]